MFRRGRRRGTLPPTPVEQFRRDAKFTLPTATQGQSPLFTLPVEIQQMIFTKLLGDQLVHVHLRHKDDKYERDGAPSKASRWVHCVCCLDRNTVPHYHEEENHRWCFLSTNVLRTCQSAYLQCLPVLYQTNTLSFRCFKDATAFESLFVHFSSLVQSIDLYCTDCGCYTEPRCRLREHSSWRMNLCHFDKYYHLFFTTTGSSTKIRNSRLYFENDGSPFFYHQIKMLLSSTSLPVAQIQIFVPGDLDKRTDEAVRVEAVPGKRGRISIIRHAKGPFSDRREEIPDEEAEQHADDSVQDDGLAVEESE